MNPSFWYKRIIFFLRNTMGVVLKYILPLKRFSASIESLDESAFFNVTEVVQRDHIVSIFPYSHPLIRNLIGAFKYEQNTRARDICAKALNDVLTELSADEYSFVEENDRLFTMIPRHRKRVRERGYDHLEALMRTLGNRYGYPITKTLHRTRNTKPFNTLSKTKRQQEIKGCFEVIENVADDIVGKVVYIIDDITTTGSTMHEARKMLLRAGARDVVCIALSRAE